MAPSPFGGTISVPDLTGTEGDGGLQQITVTGSSPGGTISGPAYAGRGDFVAYLLGVDGDPKDLFHIVTGTETDFTALPVQDDDIRAYSLTNDPIQNVDVAFFNPSFYGTLNNAAQTNLMVIEGPPGADTRTFYHWIDISGSGSAQQVRFTQAQAAGSPVAAVNCNYRRHGAAAIASSPTRRSPTCAAAELHAARRQWRFSVRTCFTMI